MYSTEESFARRWSRRAVTYSFVYLSLVLLVLTLPIWLPAALIVDAIRRTSWSATRAFLFAGLYLTAQAWTLIGCFFIWLFSGVWAGRGPQRLVDGMFWIEFAWGKFLGGGSMTIWGMRPEIEFDYEFTDRPVRGRTLRACFEYSR